MYTLAVSSPSWSNFRQRFSNLLGRNASEASELESEKDNKESTGLRKIEPERLYILRKETRKEGLWEISISAKKIIKSCRLDVFLSRRTTEKNDKEFESYQKGFLLAERPLLAALALLDVVQESGVPEHFINSELRLKLVSRIEDSIYLLQHEAEPCESINNEEDTGWLFGFEIREVICQEAKFAKNNSRLAEGSPRAHIVEQTERNEEERDPENSTRSKALRILKKLAKVNKGSIGDKYNKKGFGSEPETPSKQGIQIEESNKRGEEYRWNFMEIEPICNKTERGKEKSSSGCKRLEQCDTIQTFQDDNDMYSEGESSYRRLDDEIGHTGCIPSYPSNNAIWHHVCTESVHESYDSSLNTSALTRDSSDMLYRRYSTNCQNKGVVQQTYQTSEESITKFGIHSEQEEMSHDTYQTTGVSRIHNRYKFDGNKIAKEKNKEVEKGNQINVEKELFTIEEASISDWSLEYNNRSGSASKTKIQELDKWIVRISKEGVRMVADITGGLKWQSNTDSSTDRRSFYRCTQHEIGHHNTENENIWILDDTRIARVNNHKRTEDNCISDQNKQQKMEKPVNKGLDRQHDSLIIYQQTRRNSVSTSEFNSTEDLGYMYELQNQSSSRIYSSKKEYTSRCSKLTENRSE
ncbi:1687_t:CDS:2 [Cetraspora pellucida]|uniref:1687_t:CDS:1 n=1 Tax=Cetraspora pellucida TaxID=1433469 RepID=A0A9N9ERP2_9GLOM|nr:1687_t:CDS:2 [Cetraspora pellucida]